MADVAVDPECNNPKELFGQGVRAFILQDYESAVAALSKTSELLVVEHKDDLHDSLGEVYLYYGKSLLGLSREQNEALGDAVPKNSAEDSEEEEEPDEGIESEESDKNKTEDNSSCSSLNGESTKTDTKSNEGNAEEKSKEASDKQETDSTVETNGKDNAELSKPESSAENGEPGPSCSKEEEEEDDASDLQLAWEVLELAKKIFQSLDDKKSLADTLIVLGEVSLESENFESAINDIKQGLDIQKELFSKDSRTVAETLYKLGMAYSTNSQLDEAVDSFHRSLEYLRNRIKTLEEIKSMTQEHKDEIDEIKSLIPDIEDKIADMKIYKEEAIQRVAEVFKEPSKPIQDSGAGSSKQVTNISHLVKRKRKLDEVEEKSNEDVPAKKPAA